LTNAWWLKVYRGSAPAARHYVEADHRCADDYYLTEGTGVADQYVVSHLDGVHRATPLSPDAPCRLLIVGLLSVP
jgi:exodeoxyribonuclease V alpha subunit